MATSRAAATSSADASRQHYHILNGSRPGHTGFTTDMRQTHLQPQQPPQQPRHNTHERDRKSILDRALQKAHTAVVLDNNNNVDGAIEAYTDACDLLHQVLVRSTVADERGKLEQIRETYSVRVQELLEQTKAQAMSENKTLPVRPTSVDSIPLNRQYSRGSEPEARIEAATATRLERSRSPSSRVVQQIAPAAATVSELVEAPPVQQPLKQQRPPPRINLDKLPALMSPMDPRHVPKPLSPRRNPDLSATLQTVPSEQRLQLPALGVPQGNSTSWLGPIGGSAGTSPSSSVHSLVEGNMMGKPASTRTFIDTDVDFDAALDAAVEAAYADGYGEFTYDDPTPIANGQSESGAYGSMDDMSKERELEGFDFGLQKASSNNPPTRQSDSSGYSGSTWHSSSTSSRATGSISLSTVAEGADGTLGLGNKAMGGLPRLSEEHSRGDSPSFNAGHQQLPKSQTGSVRSRRLSGQNAKQLKIETQTQKPTHATAPANPPAIREEPSAGLRSAGTSHTDLSIPESAVYKKPQQLNGYPFHQVPLSAGSRPLKSPADTAVTISPATPGVPGSSAAEYSPGGTRMPASRPSILRKNKSSMSLRTRAISVSSPDGSDGGSLATPMSTTSITAGGRKPVLPSPLGGVEATQMSGIHIFKAEIHSPRSPGFPNPSLSNGPLPLEPCPEPVVLRPFWLLRCIHQTIVNPNGGYISNRLFVPREAWSTRGVKLKYVEDKITHLDTLTKSLERLGMVDSLDAEAVEKEMSSLELVLDAVQAVLAKKLGHEVGVNATASFIKDAPVESGSGGTTPGANGEVHYTNSRSSSKSYLSSWRKLRSKTSSTHLSNGHGPHGNAAKGEQKDKSDATAPRMASVPMTQMLNFKFSRKRENGVLNDLTGPWAGYMVSLAKFCEAVQVVDQIARQVEDPGLKKSSTAYFGLELSTRHASEFFGLFVCRWVLADMGMLLDKFVKRSTEWVLL